MAKRQRRQLSVLIIPDDGTRTREFKIEYWLVPAFVVVQAVFLGLVCLGGVFYWRSLQWEGEALRLRHDNQRARAELEWVDDLASVVTRMKLVDQQLRTMLSHSARIDPAAYSLPAASRPAAVTEEFEQQRVTVRQVALHHDVPLDQRTVPSLWPVTRSSGWVTRGFQPDQGVLLDGHSGLDIAAAEGTVVVASADGRVVFSGEDETLGLMVAIDHFSIYMTRYAHNAALIVEAGERVRKGQPIALVGNTGQSSGPHLHFEIWERGSPRDPLAYLPE